MSNTNRYQAPSAPVARLDPVADAELSSFLQSNADYYLRKWQRLRSGQSALAGFNWAAAFFPVYWLLYRRFWLVGGIWAVVSFVLGALVQAVAALASPALMVSAILGAQVLMFVGWGLMANPLLYGRAESVLRSGSQLELERRRGTSELAVWAGILVFGVIPILIGVFSAVLSIDAGS